MKTLQERIEWVLDSGKVKDAKAWATNAGLSEGLVRSWLSQARRARAEGAPDRGMNLGTVEKLAAAASVSASWLAHGEGEPSAAAAAAAVVPTTEHGGDPRAAGEHLFKLRIQREPRWLGQAEEWLERERLVPQKRSEVWNELDWYEHYVAGWRAERSRMKGGVELGVVSPPPVDEDAAAKERADRLAAARERRR